MAVGAGASAAVCVVYARAGALCVPPAPGAALVSDFPCLPGACLGSLRRPDRAGELAGELDQAWGAPPAPRGPPPLAHPAAAKRLASSEGLAAWITRSARI